MCSRLEDQPIFCYDTETNGIFDRFGVQLVGISFGFGEYCCYIPVGHYDDHPQLDINYVLDRLRPIFENQAQEKICHNVKFDEMVLDRYDIKVAGAGNDTYVMAWLLDETKATKKLKPLVELKLGYKMQTYEEVIDAAPRKKGQKKDYNFAKVLVKDALSYAADDSYWTFKLYEYQKKELEQENLWHAYEKVERPLQRVLRLMEKQGVEIDTAALQHADERLPKIIEEVEASIYEQAGEVFNIGSGAQLGPILFEKLGIGKNVPKTPKGQYSTNKTTLEQYSAKHKVVENVLRRKKIQKTHSTFIQGLQKFVGTDGKIHPSFNGCGTVTGRLSGSSPNLQQIEGDEVEEIRVRNFFIPSPGYRFVVADYEQVEYRLMAHFSKDEKMLEAFASGHDFHAETARRAFDIPPEVEVKMRQRFIAKSINFGIGYGRGPMSLAEVLDCSLSEAKQYIADYYETFRGLKAYKDHVISQARQQGFVRTLAGRKRRLLPEIRSGNYGIRAHAERQAFNTKIQGSAADLIKLAMICLKPELDSLGARMIIQIHDELVIEALEDKAEESLQTAKEIMEYPVYGKNPLILPLSVDPKIVDRWGDAK